MENKFKFLTKYSLSKKLKNKWFLVGNIIVAIIIICLVNIDQIVKTFGGDFDNETKIKIIDNTGYYDRIKDNLNNLSKVYGDSKLKIVKETNDENKAKKSLKDSDDILLIVNNDESNVFNIEFISDTYIDTIKYQSILSLINNTKTQIALEKLNISGEDLENAKEPVSVKRTFVDETKTKDEEGSRTLLSVLSLVIVLPCFMLIVFLVQMIGAEINEEKSTRGMEIIIGNVSAKTHFFSKILSSNLFVLIQGALIFVYGLIGLIIRKLTSASLGTKMINEISSTLDLNSVTDMISKGAIMEKLSYVIPLVLVLLVLSFLAYSLLAGILASMTTNMENFQQLQTPLMVISVIGYYLIFVSSMFPGALFVKVVSVIPLISISLAPSLLLSGEIGVSLVILAIILLIILNYILIKYGLKIYKVGILNYSETGLWKKIFKAVKEK